MKIIVKIKTRELLTAMVKRNLDKITFAFKIRTSPGYLSELIYRRRNPSPEMRKRILRRLKGALWDDIFEIEEASDTTWV